ncbi:MAG: redoxin domain-containing protein [Nitrospira defluvii]|nr:redoxin domain-containing protein [Nitrospira defluvii]
MKRIGAPSLNFRAPALVAGTLTYLGSTQFTGRWAAICFLPYLEIVEPDFVDRQANTLKQLDTTLLIVSSGTRPLHRVWIDHPTKPRTPLLYDPLGRLHRSFGVAVAQIPVRCQTFLIDRAGLLRFHLIHDFTDHGLGAIQEILTMSQIKDSKGVTAKRSEHDADHEAITASSEVEACEARRLSAQLDSDADEFLSCTIDD